MTSSAGAASGVDLDNAPQARLSTSADGDLETDVLVIGSGPAGGAAALALATLGVQHMVITKYRWTANTPRAHITNQRTTEIFRDLGIEAAVLAQGTPHALMAIPSSAPASPGMSWAGCARGAPTPPGKPTTCRPARRPTATSRRRCWSRSSSGRRPRWAAGSGSTLSTPG